MCPLNFVLSLSGYVYFSCENASEFPEIPKSLLEMFMQNSSFVDLWSFDELLLLHYMQSIQRNFEATVYVLLK